MDGYSGTSRKVGRSSSRSWRGTPFAVALAIAATLGAGATAAELAPTVVVVGQVGAHSAFQLAFDAFAAKLRGSATIQDRRGAEDEASFREAVKSGSGRLVFALGASSLAQARTLAPDVPRVFALAEENDCALSPRDHETGVVLRIPADEMVRVLVAASKHVHRVAYLASASANRCGPDELDQALKRSGLEAVRCSVSSVREGLQALREVRSTADALILLPNPDVISDETVEYSVAAGLERKIPVVGFSPRIAESGALLSVSLDPAAIGAQAADLARRMLAGETPAPELPHKTRVSVNYRTARLIRLPITDELRAIVTEGIGEP